MSFESLANEITKELVADLKTLGLNVDQLTERWHALILQAIQRDAQRVLGKYLNAAEVLGETVRKLIAKESR